MNKSRLLREEDVIKAVNKHTNDDGNLDNDISCILEEVPGTRKVFIFDTNLDSNMAVALQHQLMMQIKEGCVVLDNNIREVKIEEL